MDQLLALARQLEARWKRLPSGQRLALIGVSGLALVVIVWSTGLARSGEYSVVFSNLPDEELAAVAAKFKENKIPYELGERGSIKVPTSQAQDARLLAASQGLTTRGNGAGMEMFNEPHFGFTEFAEKVNYQRALEGEIGRTIGRLDGIENARVHLVVPQARLFAANQQSPTASVVIQMKGGRRLDPGQVQSISQLVSNSVEGLKPENVSLLDGTGNVLTDRSAANDPARQSDRRTDTQRVVESRIQEEVKAMLTRLLGPDKALVRVTAELDWDQYEANSETFSPTDKPPQVRTQREITEDTRGGSSAGGVPGSDSNVPTYAGQQGGAQNQSQRTEKSTSFELSKTVEKIVRATGGIKRISVAAAVDSSIVADAEQFDAISRLIATAAGLDVNRGDKVTLTSLPFAAPAEPEKISPVESARMFEMALQGGRFAAMIIGPLIVLFLLRQILKDRPVEQETPLIPLSAAGERPIGDQSRPPIAPIRDVRNLPHTHIQEEVQSFARSEPAAVAQIVRTWLREDQGVR